MRCKLHDAAVLQRSEFVACHSILNVRTIIRKAFYYEPSRRQAAKHIEVLDAATMPLQFDDNDLDTLEKDPSKPLLTPRPYGAGRVRLRLMMLVGMLGLVIVAMNEAGKPENWAWMGFDKQPIEVELPTDKNAKKHLVPLNAEGIPPGSESTRSTTNNSGNSISIVPEQDPVVSLSQLQPLKVDYPKAATRFWRQTFSSLSSEQRKTLLLWTRTIRAGHEDDGQKKEAPSDLLLLLSKQRELFHQKMFDEITRIPDGDNEKQELSEQYHQSEAIWRDHILPALASTSQGQDVTIGQQQKVKQLQVVLDRLLANQVEDRTTVGWKGDRDAWVRYWENCLSSSPSDQAVSVSRLQLMSQPKYYRGKPIKLSGWVRAGKRVSVSEDSAIGLPAYYELWLRPENSNVGPICVCCAELPDGFPELGESFQSLNQKASFSGIFFKVRKYVTNERAVEYCPVVISRTLAPIKTEVISSQVDSDKASIGWHWLFPAVIVLPVFAVFIAWAVFRDTEVTKRDESPQRKKELGHSLEALKENNDVETDLERIIKLEESAKNG